MSITDNKAQAVLAFANRLVHQFSSPNSAPVSSFPDTDLYFGALPLSRNDTTSEDRLALDRSGVQLWNASCKLIQDDDVKHRVEIARARAYAFLLLESGESYRTKDIATSKRALNTGIKAAKDCLSCELVAIGSKIIDNLAEHHTRLERCLADASEEEETDFKRHRSEFWLLRATLAWKQQRLDLADHFLATFTSSVKTDDIQSTIKAVDLCYEIGVQNLKISHSEIACRWLKRAHKMVEQAQGSDVSIVGELGDLDLNVAHAYARSLLSTNSSDAVSEAGHILDHLQQRSGHKLAVMTLKLDFIRQSDVPDLEAFSLELLKIIRTVHIFENNHNLIMHHIHYLKSFDAVSALKALKEYILRRLTAEDTQRLAEGAIITYLSVALSCEPGASVDLLGDISAFHDSWKRVLPADAAHAGLLLLWREIEKRYNADGETTRAWCQVALHEIFQNAGDRNIGKFQRKLMVCHLDTADYAAAERVLSKMSAEVRRQPLSLYLSYSTALHRGNSLASETVLQNLVKNPDKNCKLLLACVGETMKYGDQRQEAVLLQRILDKFNYNMPPEIDLCTMLRCTASLLLAAITKQESLNEELLERLCKVFKAATTHSVKCNVEAGGKKSDFPIKECEWFEKTSFNVALHNIDLWPPKYVIDLLEHSKQIKYPPTDLSARLLQEQQHKATVLYVQGVLYIGGARNHQPSQTIEDLPRTSIHPKERPKPGHLRNHLYQKGFQTFTQLRRVFKDLQSDIDEKSETLRMEVEGRVVTMIPLAFEAVLYNTLSDVDQGAAFDQVSLDELLVVASRLDAPAKTYALIADLVLSSTVIHSTPPTQSTTARIPTPACINLLSKVISSIRAQDGFDIVRAARWTRCVVQIVLDSGSSVSSSRGNPLDIIDSIINEAIDLASEAVQNTSSALNSTPKATNQFYPSDELEWLSTTLFNLSIDFYVADKADEGQKWAHKAVQLAVVLTATPQSAGGDQGMLAKCLRERCAKIGWRV